MPSVLEQRTDLVQIQQKLPGNEGTVVDAVFFPDFPRQSRKEEEITLDLPGQFQLLYYAPDGSLQSSCVRWENKLQILSDEDSSMSFRVYPIRAVQAVSGVEELNLTTQMKLEMQTHTQTAIPQISGLEMGELQEPDPGRPSMVLCRREDQSLWEIAKRCGSTVDEIRRINRLESEPASDQILLVPVI